MINSNVRLSVPDGIIHEDYGKTDAQIQAMPIEERCNYFEDEAACWKILHSQLEVQTEREMLQVQVALHERYLSVLERTLPRRKS